MFDIRYHIATIVGIFLALGIGMLIGSTLIGGDVMLDQQKKMISQLESKFEAQKQREEQLVAENRINSELNQYYEEYSQAISMHIIKDRLRNYKIAIIITGGQSLPTGLVNTLTFAGAQIKSTTVVLPAIKLNDGGLNLKLCEFYSLDKDTPPAELRKMVALSIAGIIINGGDERTREFLQDNSLVKLNGNYGGFVNGVIIFGGAQYDDLNYAENLDGSIITSLLNSKYKVFGCENSKVDLSYMKTYQKYDISTIDDIDLTPGQVALVRALEGETGDYGIKSTAKKFMPSLPSEFIGG